VPSPAGAFSAIPPWRRTAGPPLGTSCLASCRSCRELLDLLDGDLSDDEVLAGVVRRLGEPPATSQARDEAVRWASEAVAALAPLPPSPAHDALRAYAEAVVAPTA
jgi:hypothetical protein